MGTENKYVTKIIKTNEDIVAGTKELATRLNNKFTDKSDTVVMISIMKGGLPFTLELMKHVDFDMVMDFITSSSYYLDGKAGEPKITYEATEPIKGKHVVLCDDLIDSGDTAIKITSVLEAYGPKSITVAAAIGKPSRKKTKYDEMFIWEEEPGGFLLGFGLDYDEKYRNLPYIAIMEVPEEEKN